MEEKYVIINISGQIYKIQRHLKIKLPAENKRICITENGEMQTHFIYYRDKDVFERVLKFYGGSCIHIPHNVCPVEFVEELKFWGINPSALSSCCFLKCKQQTAENVLLHTYMKDQGIEEVDTLSTAISKLQRLLYGRHILEINGNSMPCKVYFALSTFCILLAVFSIAISTLPEYRRHDSDTNVTEHEYACSSCSGAFSDVNIAFMKPTKLSSTRNTGCCDSDYAVDGDTRDWVKDSVWEFRCSHTVGVPNQQQEWWAVDLLDIYTIRHIDIYGRTDDRCEYTI
ncbi:potassium voltage-gated channel protein Shal-like [Mytilus trossulus]|uniref:potassium voltage-gated channel protein Shal-like n=1 Tax=Mytilus trossulus TaxID=6551 RepID=UPI0030040F87